LRAELVQGRKAAAAGAGATAATATRWGREAAGEVDAGGCQQSLVPPMLKQQHVSRCSSSRLHDDACVSVVCGREVGRLSGRAAYTSPNQNNTQDWKFKKGNSRILK